MKKANNPDSPVYKRFRTSKNLIFESHFLLQFRLISGFCGFMKILIAGRISPIGVDLFKAEGESNPKKSHGSEDS